MLCSQNRGKVTKSDVTEYQNAYFRESVYYIVVYHHLRLRVVILRTHFLFIQETFYFQTFSQSSELWCYLVLELWIFALVAALVLFTSLLEKCACVEKYVFRDRYL